MDYRFRRSTFGVEMRYGLGSISIGLVLDNYKVQPMYLEKSYSDFKFKICVLEM